MKLLTYSFQAFARELKAWSKSTHANILPLKGFIHFKQPGDDVGEAWIVTDWQPDGNILAYVQDNKVEDYRRLELVSIRYEPRPTRISVRQNLIRASRP